MPTVLIPIHILYHDHSLEQPIISQLIKWAGQLQGDDSPVRLNIIRMGVVLDALSDPRSLVKKLSLEHNFRVDFKGSFASILSDYKWLAENVLKEIYFPEILIFLKLLPTVDSEWGKIWKQILEYQPSVGVYWINKSRLEPNMKKDLDAELSRFCPKGKTLGYSIIEPPESANLDFLLTQKFPLLKQRIEIKLGELRKRQGQLPLKSSNTTATNLGGGDKPAIMIPAKSLTPGSYQQSSPIGKEAPPVKNAKGEGANLNATQQDIIKEGAATPDTQKKFESPLTPAGDTREQPAAGVIPQETSADAGQDAVQAIEDKPLVTGTQPDDGTEAKITQPLPPKVIQPAQWQVKDPPPELEDRFPHTFKDSRLGPRNWCMVGASRRGKMHENDGTFREDAMQIEVASHWLLVAVADGAGSHHLSRVGSNLAVKTAISVMKEKVEKESPSNPVAKDALEEALKKAWEALYKEAESERRQADKVTFKDLSTTLLLLMYHPGKNLVGVAQIGDGLLAAQLEDNRIALLGKPESGEYSGETYFLTNHKPEELASKVETPNPPGPIKMFFVMTDGVADDFYPPLDPQKGLPLLIRYLPPVINSLDLEASEASLLELINYSKQASFDDRTLVLIYQQEKISSSSQVVVDEPVKASADKPAAASAADKPPEISPQPNPSNIAKDGSADKSPQLDSNPNEA